MLSCIIVSGSGSATPDEEDIVVGSKSVGTRSCQRHVLRENGEKKSKGKTPRIEIEKRPGVCRKTAGTVLGMLRLLLKIVGRSAYDDTIIIIFRYEPTTTRRYSVEKKKIEIYYTNYVYIRPRSGANRRTSDFFARRVAVAMRQLMIFFFHFFFDKQ